MSVLYLIRHGQASFGKETYDKLSPLGIRQSEMMANHFRRLETAFDAIYSGTAVRHAETAAPFLADEGGSGSPSPGVRQLAAFDEYDSEGVLRFLIPSFLENGILSEGDVQQMFGSNRSFQRVFEAVMRRWVTGEYDCPGVETWREVVARVNSGIEEVTASASRGQRVAVYTSGGPIAVAVARALDLSDEQTLMVSWQVANGSISRFKFTSGRFMLSSFNEFAYLEEGGGKMVTYR